MKKIFFILVFFFGFIFSVKVTLAATYYVDGSRPDDSGTGTSWITAEKTIAAGVAHLASGDTLLIGSGTYNEPMVFDGKNFSSETFIKSDDKSGNPGVVTITGTVSKMIAGNVTTTWNIYGKNTSHLTIDGRQSVIEGNASYGFILNAGAMIDEYSTQGTIKILRVSVTGTKHGGDSPAIGIEYSGNATVAYNQINQTGGNDGDCIRILSAGGVATMGGSVHHNDVKCNPANGYGGITNKRCSGLDMYNNWIHDIGNGGVGIVIRDVSTVGSDGGDVYNNVIDSGSGSMRKVIDIRGYSTGSGGSPNVKFFNNTAIGSFSEGFMLINDPDCDGNQIFNNLLIGSVPNFVVSWGYNTGSNNSLHDNYVTGTVGSWFGGGTASVFSVTTPNYASQGSSFINMSGAKPSPYYDLSASKDGVTVASLATDYNGNSRNNPPDVGAFEFGGVTPPNTAPAAPTGVKVI